MRLVLGVDGGNTKTIALVVREDGAVLGTGRAGCADVHAHAGSAAGVDEIVRAVSEALTAVGIQADQLAATAFSLAGADWEEDFAFLREAVGRRLGVESPNVVNDALGLLRCGSPTSTGVAVGVGTGAAIGARSSSGAVFHLGFWPDPMGGDALARAAARAVFRADLGLAPATSLTPRLTGLFRVESAAELRFALNRRDRHIDVAGYGIPAIALDEAEAGDPVAVELVAALARSLGEAARVTADAVGLDDEDPLVLGGGLFNHRSTLLADGIAATGGFDVVVRSELEPAVGAVLIAFDLLALTPPLATLVGSLPERKFFATA